MYIVRRKRKHLTWDDRIKIESLYKAKHTQQYIADAVGVSQSTISEELKRGRTVQLDWRTYDYIAVYTADSGQRYADAQKINHGKGLKIGKRFDYLAALEKHILNDSSPYDALQKEKANFDIHISKTTFYRYLQERLFKSITYKHLPRGRKKKKQDSPQKRTTHPLHRSIESRSPAIKTRAEFGHWEMDSIIGKAKGKKESCLVLTERKTRLEILFKVNEKTALDTVKALSALRHKWGKNDFTSIFKTITIDNGSEFADQMGLDATGTTVFYCHPSCPSERGSNENQNILLRRKFPKGQSMARKTQKDATSAQHFINHYHRHLFKGETSAQQFAKELPALNLQNPKRIAEFFALDIA